MDSVLDQVTAQLERLGEYRERFVIRIASLPADLAFLGLLDELREAAFSAIQLCHLHEQQAAFPLVRLAFEAAQRVIVLATDDDYARVGVDAWLYYLRKDTKIVQFARDAQESHEWYSRRIGEMVNIWSRYNPAAGSLFHEASERLDAFRKGKADNFVGGDMGAIVAERYQKLAIGLGKSPSELKELNRAIYGALSRESHARIRLEPEKLQVLEDGSVKIVPRSIDQADRRKLVLGCLETSLAEALAATAYLSQNRDKHSAERLQFEAERLAAKPLPAHFRPDLGLHLIKAGGTATTFRFPNVPVRKVGIFSDGTIRWSANIKLAPAQEFIATFDVPRQLATELSCGFRRRKSFIPS